MATIVSTFNTRWYAVGASFADVLGNAKGSLPAAGRKISLSAVSGGHFRTNPQGNLSRQRPRYPNSDPGTRIDTINAETGL